MSATEHQVISPFGPTDLVLREAPDVSSPIIGEALRSPFSDSVMTYTEQQRETDTINALLAEFEDDDFQEALEALADEAAARHLRAAKIWSAESNAPTLATAEADQWMESVVAEADVMLGKLEAYFADRPIDSLHDGEMETVAGVGEPERLGFVTPVEAQEQFFKKLLDKAKSIAKGVAKVAKTGIQALGKLGLGGLFGLLRKLVRPLLKRVLDKAIGRLPAALRPLADRLAKKFTGEAEAVADDADEDDPYRTLAESFDRQVAGLLLTSNDAVADQLIAEAESDVDQYASDQPLRDLDEARARLARELADAPTGEPPTAAMERFIPAVMAAMPLIRMGIRVVGRQRVVDFLARALANLIQGSVGAGPAQQLSRHIADTGLRLLGLEAEGDSDPVLGTEPLVAATEDTVRHLMSLPPESLENELLLEVEIEDAFAEAASRHLPAAVLRPEVVEREVDAEGGIWVMMPRATRPLLRYKKYSRIIPVRIGRPAARSLVLSEGETLEERLLDAGVTSWPAECEMEVYELLEGAELGHVAAFESGGPDGDASNAATEYEELTETAAAILAGKPALAATGRRGRPGSGRRGGTRYYRLRVGGRPLRRRRPFSLRLDVAQQQPVLKVHLRISERGAHAIAGHLTQRRVAPVVSGLRRVTGSGAQQVMGRRLDRMLTRQGIQFAPGAGLKLAGKLADAMVRAVSKQLPDAATTLAQAAKDPEAGITLSFGFTFADKASLATADPKDPTLTIRPGWHDD
jgi:hypothetical protein